MRSATSQTKSDECRQLRGRRANSRRTQIFNYAALPGLLRFFLHTRFEQKTLRREVLQHFRGRITRSASWGSHPLGASMFLSVSTRSLCTTLIFAVIFCPAISQGQQPVSKAPPAASVNSTEPPAPPAPARRPIIGLALSGGGALGLAHVGVLQWLEESHIPVDRLAGTSMGALVGALFATGRNGAEMRQFVKGIRWDEALLSEPSYDQLSYRRK